MKRTFEEALANRRSYYRLGNDRPVTDEEIIRIIHEAVKHVPSAYNSQSTRIVLLLGDEHRRLWDIVKSILKMMLPEEIYAQTEKKIERSFANGHGTVLFFEDTSVVNKFEEAYPLYRQNFKTWSQHTSHRLRFCRQTAVPSEKMLMYSSRHGKQALWLLWFQGLRFCL